MQSTVTTAPSISKEKKSFFSTVSPSVWKFVQIFSIGFVLWYFCQPKEITDKAWLLFTIFVSTIIAIILKPLPMGALSVVAIGFLTTTKTLTLTTILHGFAND